MEPWVVRVPRRSEGDRLIEIYRDAFGVRSPGRRLNPIFLRDRSLVAVRGSEVAGLLCIDRADDSIDPALSCLEPLTRSLLEPLASSLPPEEKAAVEILAPPSLAPRRGERDLLITAIAVDPRLRRQGAGRALALAGTAGPAAKRQIFAHCVAGSGSRELLEGLGFAPLVRFARYYEDGTGMTLLYRPPLVR